MDVHDHISSAEFFWSCLNKCCYYYYYYLDAPGEARTRDLNVTWKSNGFFERYVFVHSPKNQVSQIWDTGHMPVRQGGFLQILTLSPPGRMHAMI